ncbi:lamina-associated polypeptide 2, isoforms beta/delta/epsilon/gamma-like isoform X2 [Stegostoma tigrinum]|uniref:lamina-associated polypeptide 2, isoforms beta/delta/epsilon/gamma-like isoform X2 n=1 Tax=Stegostoma tigrinum TaxID=3053191 RepID=UPI00202B83AD|nr:lamina-associated polypeptide 2, isoforms beta/delta/epsilon/gamma-like isoform X2 [Stegostoma tigrinum]
MLNMSNIGEYQDPSHLTKSRLKSELIAHNVRLPQREQKKEVYVQLYLKHITSKNKSELRADFSSDEEDSSEVKSIELPKLKEAEENHTDKMDVTQLSNEELKEQLMNHGVTPGPIVATTRTIYEKKLLKLMGQGPTVPPLKQNGTGDVDQYSDSEEEDDSSNQRQSTSKGTATAPKEMGDVLPQILPDEMNSPSGINATRRRPIKGAAGRPIQYKYDDFLTRATERHNYKERSSYLVTKEKKPVQRLVPVWLQILLFIIVLFILFLVYQAMESNQENPFAYFLANAGNQAASQPEQLDTQTTPDVDS